MSRLSDLPRQPLYFVRHGVTDYNRKRLVMGQIDIPLNDEGRTQARKAASLLRNVPVQSLYASPLNRALETATIIAATLHLDVFTAEGLMERHWGIYQGRDRSHRPLNTDPENGESQDAFMNRVIGTIVTLPGPFPILVVAHNGICRALRRHLGLPGAEDIVPNAVPLCFEPTANGWREFPVLSS